MSFIFINVAKQMIHVYVEQRTTLFLRMDHASARL